MKMYFKYLKHQLKISFQYKTSSMIVMLVGLVAMLTSLVAINMLFSRFKTIAGYTINDVLLTYGTVLLIFSICEFLFRGYDQFETLVIKGDLDALLLKPRSIFLQVLGYKIELSKLGRVILSIVVIVYACINSAVVWDFSRILTLILMIISGVVIFLGVFLLSSSFTIFTIRGNEVANIFTNGGKEMCNYPLDIYKKFFKNFFTFIIPFGAFNYLPLKYLLGHADATIFGHMLAPVYGMLFIIPCYFIFKWALTKYTSSGT